MLNAGSRIVNNWIYPIDKGYVLKYVKDGIGENSISCIPFEQKSFQQYMKIYNACFYEMRKSLDIKPYNFLSD